MNIQKISKRIAKSYPSVKVDEYRGCVRLQGELDDWADVVAVGQLAVCADSLGVLNDVKLKGFVDTTEKIPPISDKTLEGSTPDVLVIGGGVTGCAIARELCAYKLSVMLVDKHNDVAMDASSRNDGCVHVGIDLHSGQQKLKYLKLANPMFEQLSSDLDVPFDRGGHLIMFSKRWERLVGMIMMAKARTFKLPKFKMLSREELLSIEPNSPDWAVGAILMPSGGIVSPYKLTIGFADNAVMNGAQISLNTIVTAMEVKDGKIISVDTNRGRIYPKLVVNAAGVYADKIADMAGDRTFTIHPRKGTNLILDKKNAFYARGSLARAPFAPMPKELKAQIEGGQHSKGGGVVRTVDGNVLVGPNAIEVPQREDNSTEIKAVNEIIAKQKYVARQLKTSDIITYFSGTRAATYEEDFVVRKGIFTKNIIESAGIQSPGLTAAPAIAVEVAGWAAQMLGARRNPDFNPKVKKHLRLAAMDAETRNDCIKRNPDYGEIVCRCEEISKGEIIDALNSPLKVDTVDGVKRRARPGMGRCQGGFCSPLVVKIISQQRNIPPEQVEKGDSGSTILFGATKNPDKSANSDTAGGTL